MYWFFIGIVIVLIFLITIDFMRIFRLLPFGRKKAQGNIMSHGEEVLSELNYYRNCLRAIPVEQYTQQSFDYYKYLRSILVRYVKKHYSVIIHKSMDKDETNVMMENCPQEHNEITGLYMVFSRLEELKRNGIEKDKLERLYDVMIAFFTEKTKQA